MMQQEPIRKGNRPPQSPADVNPDPSSETGPLSSWVLALLTLLYISMLTATKWPVGTDLVKLIFPIGPAKAVTLADLYLVVLGIFTSAMMFRERYNLWNMLNGYTVSIAGFTGAMAVSSAVNGFDVDAVKEIVQWIEMGVLVVIVMYWLRNSRQFRTLMSVLMILGTIQAGYEFLSYMAFGLPTVENKRLFVKFTGFCFLVGLDVVWRERNGYWIPALVVLLLAIGVSTERKVYVVLPVCVLLYVVVKLYQRLDNPRRFLTWSALAATSMLVICLGTWGAFPAWTEGTYDMMMRKLDLKGRMNVRYYLWRTGWNMWMDHFVFGIGPNSFHVLKPEYSNQPAVLKYSLHNMMFGYVLNTGLLGLLWLIALLAQPFRFFLSTRSSRDDDAVITGILVIYVCGVIFFNAYNPFARFLLFSTLGIAAAVQYNFPENPG